MTIKIKYDITPENANEFGLIWWQDYIYDPEAPSIANKDINAEVESGEIVLGSPASKEFLKNNGVGIYRKLENTKK